MKWYIITDLSLLWYWTIIIAENIFFFLKKSINNHPTNAFIPWSLWFWSSANRKHQSMNVSDYNFWSEICFFAISVWEIEIITNYLNWKSIIFFLQTMILFIFICFELLIIIKIIENIFTLRIQLIPFGKKKKWSIKLNSWVIIKIK